MLGQEGEKELLFAILHRAFEDLEGHTGGTYEYVIGKYPRAKEWIADSGDAETPFCFEWICNQLSIDPNIVRKQLAVKARVLAS